MDKILEVLKGKYEFYELPNYNGEALYLINIEKVLKEVYDFNIYLTRLNNKIVLTDLGSLKKALTNILTDNKPNIINGIIHTTMYIFKINEKGGLLFSEVNYFNDKDNDVPARLSWLATALVFALEKSKEYVDAEIDEYEGGSNG